MGSAIAYVKISHLMYVNKVKKLMAYGKDINILYKQVIIVGRVQES